MESLKVLSCLLLLALTVLALAHVGHAAVWLEKVVENPMYPRHCKDQQLNKYFPDQSSWYPTGSCLMKRCRFPYISTASCASVSAEPPCTLVVDASLQYPKCCPQPQCPTKDIDDNTI